MRVRFGECDFDTDTRELLRAGTTVRISGKAFRLLEVLVEKRPKALSKDHLQDLVWPGVFVAEVNLAALISELRAAIGDDARESAFIRTVYGFGYAFSGDVQDAATPREERKAPSGRYRLVWGRKKIALVEGENILGREPDSSVWIDRDTVSRRHARICIAGDTATLEDLGSKNGTRLRGRRLEGTVALADGDEIRLGSVPLTVRLIRKAASTATASTTSR